MEKKHKKTGLRNLGPVDTFKYVIPIPLGHAHNPDHQIFFW